MEGRGENKSLWGRGGLINLNLGRMQEVNDLARTQDPAVYNPANSYIIWRPAPYTRSSDPTLSDKPTYKYSNLGRVLLAPDRGGTESQRPPVERTNLSADRP
ncbi:unnamed protein product [Pleuronectes platessa]|uniref:Uncharacterized protein n=1 Tax=Pleuronectes platessa TaxID=8262 RepID=A0A9N7YGY7_PLEPL|nr:unnamed protein product [Pleuronectes platessa]